MPAASASPARSKRAAAPTRAKARAGERQRRAAAGEGARVRWDRLGRAAMLCVMAALVYLYLSAGIHMLSTWRQSRNDSAVVRSLSNEHTALERQHETLGKQATLEAEARRLGMMKKNEQPYMVGPLPDN